MTEQREILRLLNNRQRVREPRKGVFWCGCDLNLVWEGKKCEICHRRGGKGRRNKRVGV